MKAQIVTLHRAFNFGAFLQAYALSETINGLGYECDLYSPSNLKNEYLRYRVLFDTRRPRALVFAFRQWLKYLSFQKKYFKKAKGKDEYDFSVVGSDEVWNLSNKTFIHFTEFFGNKLNAKKIIAYAPSCGQYDGENIPPYATEGLNKFSSISCRDTNTQQFLKKTLNVDVPIVADPTLLYDFEENEKCSENKFLMIYGLFFDKNEIESIKNFAKEKNLQLISVGVFNKWCKKNVAVTPFGFLSYMRNADFVVTNMFHGTIYAIKNKKNFATFLGTRAKKILPLLENLSLSERIIGKSSLSEVLSDTPDYTLTLKAMNNIAENSMKFLKTAIENGEELK